MSGCVELICGCMFSGKTGRLIERVEAATAQGLHVAVFKHARDDRYAPSDLVAHDGRRTSATAVGEARTLPGLAASAGLVVVDEAQFFGDDLGEVCRELASRGVNVLVAGLDRDCWGLPFGPMPRLEAIADRIVRTTAHCAACGQPAEFTQRRTEVVVQGMVGGSDRYEPRCGKCFQAPPMALRC